LVRFGLRSSETSYRIALRRADSNLHGGPLACGSTVHQGVGEGCSGPKPFARCGSLIETLAGCLAVASFSGPRAFDALRIHAALQLQFGVETDPPRPHVENWTSLESKADPHLTPIVVLEAPPLRFQKLPEGSCCVIDSCARFRTHF